MAILSSTGIAGFLSSVKATGKQVLNNAGKQIPEYVGDFVSGISGWIIRNNGEAEFKSVYARDKFITNEFVYNRIKVTEDEEIISSSIKIASYVDNGNSTCTVYPDLREGDINPLANDDLLVGYYHNPANSGVIYAIQKFLALDDPNSENQSIILEPVGDSLPYQHMIIVRVGNVHDTDRQSFIRISSRTNCQYFYDGINSWEAYDDPKCVKCVLGKADIGLIPAWASSVIGSVKRWFGLIADGVILRGTFVLQSSNKTVETELEGVNTTITDIETRFEIKEGQVAASVKQAEKYATSASDNAGFADEAANAATGILNTIKEREASINITAQGIESKVGEIETQVDAATGILQNISEKETSINQTAAGIESKVSETKTYSENAVAAATVAAGSASAAEAAKKIAETKASEAKQTAEGFQSTVSETTKKAVDDAVAGADALIEEKVSTQVTQSAREWKVEVMGADSQGNPNQILAAINASKEGIKIKGDKIEIDGTLIAQAIIATGLNIDNKFVVSKNENGDISVKVVGDVTARKVETSSEGKRITITPSDNSLTVYDSTGRKVIEISFTDGMGNISSFPRIAAYGYDSNGNIQNLTSLVYAGVTCINYINGVVNAQANIGPLGISVSSDSSNQSILSRDGLRIFKNGSLYKSYT
ncbi:hypothetical protein HMPREF1214_02797 [Bacteroides sp. HPS0048]|uniref:hypothetical protein n=1 Tax=Bacteroides sp. HPS0048 TaxID=1078089 RepID=UPI000368D917|nr:hypothetical protein [Bacteroides sp. HPS0048]EOA57283.1 hypothetical protein HMPREF1214_02797 [Bacteroides sp. HPS0048]